MEVYQPLNWTFNVSEEWSKAVGPVVIEELLKKALDNYRSGQRGIVTENGVSALVINEGFGLLFIRMKKIKDNAIWRNDVFFPMKTSIVKFEHGMPTKRVPVYDVLVRLTRDHPFSDWFQSRSNHSQVLTTAPVLDEIFEAKGITGKEMYNYAIETTYRTHKELIPRETFIQPAHTSDSITVMMKVSDDQWEMTCFNRLVPPGGSRCDQMLTYPWIACGFRMSKSPTYTFMQNHELSI